MTLPIRFLPEARAEFDEALDWYEQQRAGLGVEFADSMQVVFDRLAATPTLFPAVFRDIRRAVVRRFPYSVLFRVEADRVVVVAVFHSSRDPRIWQTRA